MLKFVNCAQKNGKIGKLINMSEFTFGLYPTLIVILTLLKSMQMKHVSSSSHNLTINFSHNNL